MKSSSHLLHGLVMGGVVRKKGLDGLADPKAKDVDELELIVILGCVTVPAAGPHGLDDLVPRERPATGVHLLELGQKIGLAWDDVLANVVAVLDQRAEGRVGEKHKVDEVRPRPILDILLGEITKPGRIYRLRYRDAAGRLAHRCVPAQMRPMTIWSVSNWISFLRHYYIILFLRLVRLQSTGG